jgi:DNA-binding beta-propeller fold protein YncE
VNSNKVIRLGIGAAWVLAFILNACSVAPTQQPTAISVTATPNYGPFESVFDQARGLCETAAEAPVTGGFLETPSLSLLKRDDPGSDWVWEPLQISAGGVATDVASVKSLACIRQEGSRNGQYEDGAPAFDNVWQVRFVNWPAGEVVGGARFVGPAPGSKLGGGSGFGEAPVADLLDFLDQAAAAKLMFLGGDQENTWRARAFSLDGRLLAVVDERGHVDVVDMQTGASVQSLSVPNSASGVALSPDGSKVAVDLLSETLVFDVQSGQQLYSLGGEEPAFSADGKILAVALSSYEIPAYEIWLADSETGAVTGKLDHGGKYLLEDMAFSADGRWLAVSPSVAGSKLVVWDVASRTAAHVYPEDFPSVLGLAISPDGRLVAFVRPWEEGLNVWEVESGEIVFAPFELADLRPLLFTPDGKYLVLAATERATGKYSTYLLDLADYRLRPLIEHRIGSVLSFGISPDGDLLIAMSYDAILTVDLPD